jgi:hypothetical protein
LFEYVKLFYDFFAKTIEILSRQTDFPIHCLNKKKKTGFVTQTDSFFEKNYCNYLSDSNVATFVIPAQGLVAKQEIASSLCSSR